MRKCACEECGQSVPIGESSSVFERNLCKPCADAAGSVRGGGAKDHFAGNVDPTVCSNCGADAGDRELPLVVGMPVCETCEEFFRNRPFPAWIKAAAVGLVVIVVFALVWNFRFVMGYVEFRQMDSAMAAGDMDKADKCMSAAASHVPESTEVTALAGYFHGISLMQHDRCGEALASFKACSGSPVTAELQIDELIKQAEMGAAFDAGNYDEFLRLSIESAKALPNDVMAVASVASAYACKYAKDGNEEFRQKSLDILEKVRAVNPGPQFDDYAMRVRHRLDTRDIIKPDEFHKRFPNGWHPEEEKETK